MKKFVNFTVLHKRYDPRVFERIACTLAANNHQSELWVVDELGDEITRDVSIKSLGHKFWRFLPSAIFRVFKEKPDFLIIHDPILLLISPLIFFSGAKILFDSHEDVVEDIYTKEYIPERYRRLVSFFYRMVETLICKGFIFCVITPSRNVKKRMSASQIRCEILHNYPTARIVKSAVQFNKSNTELKVLFLGALSASRNVQLMIEAVAGLERVTLSLVGPSADVDVDKLLVESGCSNVSYLGYMAYDDAVLEIDKNDVGLVVPTRSKISEEAYPVKMFEYLARGLYVIGSNFGVIAEVLANTGGGCVVEVDDSRDLRRSLIKLRDEPRLLREAAGKGPTIVTSKYCFEVEFGHLLKALL